MRPLIRGKIRKRSLLLIIALLVLVSLAGCGFKGSKDSKATNGEANGNGIETTLAGTTAMTATNVTVNTDTASSSEQTGTSGINSAEGGTNPAGGKEQLLQSASVDLNNDGVNEQVEAVQIMTAGGDNSSGEIEGILKIKSGETESQLTFCKKSAGLTGVLTSLQFEDLDGDGAKDVFIIIPDNGAAFSISSYFIYSFRKNLSHTFTNDSEMIDFISDFSFKHKSGNILTLSNSKLDFSADLTIENIQDAGSLEEYMDEYEKSAWIESVPVDIAEDSKMALVKAANGATEIKVPLPIFGLATVDMIGEVDLYYTVDSNFKPVLKHFDVLDFKDNEKTKVGSCEVKQRL